MTYENPFPEFHARYENNTDKIVYIDSAGKQRKKTKSKIVHYINSAR